MSDPLPVVPGAEGTGDASSHGTAPSPDVPPTLADLLCFDLYATSRAITAAYRPALSDFDLTYPQYLVLVALGEVAEASIKDLVASLRLDHATLSPLLKRLELQGLLTRERSTVDERAVLVRLTHAGRVLHARFGLVHCALGEALGISGAEVATLQGLLRRINANLAPDARA